MLPRIVPTDQLEAGNAFMTLSRFGATVLGPALAACWWRPSALAQHSGRMPSATRWRPSSPRCYRNTAGASPPTGQNALQDIWDGIVHVWNDVPLRTVLAVIAVVNFLGLPGVQVGLPALAYARFEQGRGRPWRRICRVRPWGSGSGPRRNRPPRTSARLADRDTAVVFGAGLAGAVGRPDPSRCCSGVGRHRRSGGRLEPLPDQLDAATHRPEHAGTRHGTGHAGVGGPRTVRVGTGRDRRRLQRGPALLGGWRLDRIDRGRRVTEPLSPRGVALVAGGLAVWESHPAAAASRDCRSAPTVGDLSLRNAENVQRPDRHCLAGRGKPWKSPRCVPRMVIRIATLSPSTRMSSSAC